MADKADKPVEEAPERGLAANLDLALARAQGRFPAIEKKHTAEVRGKDGKPGYTYSYADLGDVLAAVRPILADEGLALVQRTRHDGGTVRLITELRYGPTGEVLDTDVELGQSPSNPQQFGGALTYLRRYQAAALLGIAPEEDLDAANVEPPRRGEAPARAELPPWALPVTNGNRTVLIERFGVLLGDEAGADALRFIANTLGTMPALVNMTAGLVLDRILEGDLETLNARLIDEHARRRTAAERAEVEAIEARQRADAEAAQAAAEAPDAPGPSGEEPDELTAPAENTQEAGAADSSSPLAATFATPPDAESPEGPGAGSVMPPDLTGLIALEAVKVLRGAGCTCPEPLKAATDESARVDTCPIIGHGIPF